MTIDELNKLHKDLVILDVITKDPRDRQVLERAVKAVLLLKKYIKNDQSSMVEDEQQQYARLKAKFDGK